VILTADWHLTDKPEDEYRWQIFDVLGGILMKQPQPVYILGDITDKGNKHSAVLVNRLIAELVRLTEETGFNEGRSVVILAGNHDAPLATPYYLDFINYLSELAGVCYITEPMFADKIALFPWSPNPETDWKEILAKKPRAVFMHQPVNGVVGENGMKLTDFAGVPVFPKGCKVYSGDIHTPQTVGNIEYVGAPFHIKFGDRYKTRMLRLNSDFSIAEEISVRLMRRHLVEINSTDQLEIDDLRVGDQVKLRVFMSADKIAQWPVEQSIIKDWAKANGVTISSVEAIVDIPQAMQSPEDERYTTSYEPLDVLAEFAKHENLNDDALLVTGQDLLKEEINAQRAG